MGSKEDAVTLNDDFQTRNTEFTVIKIPGTMIMMIPLANSKGCITILSYAELMHIDSIDVHPSNFICNSFNPMEKSFGKKEQVIWSTSGAWKSYCVESAFPLPQCKILALPSEGHMNTAQVETGARSKV